MVLLSVGGENRALKKKERTLNSYFRGRYMFVQYDHSKRSWKYKSVMLRSSDRWKSDSEILGDYIRKTQSVQIVLRLCLSYLMRCGEVHQSVPTRAYMERSGGFLFSPRIILLSTLRDDVWMYVYIYVVCMYICRNVCVYVCTCVCICIYNIKQLQQLCNKHGSSCTKA